MPRNKPEIARMVSAASSFLTLPSSIHCWISGTSFATYWSNAADACVPAAGQFQLAHRAISTRPGSTALLQLNWVAPRHWRDLKTIDLQLLDGKRIAGLVRFTNDGSKTGTLGIGNQAGTPGQNRSLSNGAVTLDLAQSQVRGSGPTGKSVTISFALRFARSLAGRVLKAQLGASDTHGLVQPFLPAATITIARAR